QLRDRLSFMRFAGLGLHQAVPDAKTIWPYREQLKQAGAIEGLFRRFDAVLAAKGFLAMGGPIIDATLIAAPCQKLTIEEKATIRNGGTPEGWSRAKRAQTDRDARWTLKRGRTKPKPEGTQRRPIQIAVPLFGYKSHIGIDQRYGLIRRWAVTDAAQHDSRSFVDLLDPENTASRVWADTAYRTKRSLEILERRGLSERLQFRRPPRRQLSEQQAKASASRARIRSGIEHVFAAQKHRMALFVRTIGLARAQVKIGMANLAYNSTRLAWLSTRAAPAGHAIPSARPVHCLRCLSGPLAQRSNRFFEVSVWCGGVLAVAKSALWLLPPGMLRDRACAARWPKPGLSRSGRESWRRPVPP
ncbi:IS5 family transposase, partial [Pseudoroseomonas wenyumeiae]